MDSKYSMRGLREELGWSQEQLAVFSQVSTHTVRTVEKGQSVRPLLFRSLLDTINAERQRRGLPSVSAQDVV